VDRLTGVLVQARDGDRLGLGAAIRLSQAEVWRVAAHLVGPNEADDVTQDVFVRAWRALPSFRAESSGRTWLLAIARRTCADSLRNQSRWRKLTARLHSEAVAAAARGNSVDQLPGLAGLIPPLPPPPR